MKKFYVFVLFVCYSASIMAQDFATEVVTTNTITTVEDCLYPIITDNNTYATNDYTIVEEEDQLLGTPCNEFRFNGSGNVFPNNQWLKYFSFRKEFNNQPCFVRKLRWNFGDGSAPIYSHSNFYQRVNHYYDTCGTYIVTVQYEVVCFDATTQTNTVSQCSKSRTVNITAPCEPNCGEFTTFENTAPIIKFENNGYSLYVSSNSKVTLPNGVQQPADTRLLTSSQGDIIQLSLNLANTGPWRITNLVPGTSVQICLTSALFNGCHQEECVFITLPGQCSYNPNFTIVKANFSTTNCCFNLLPMVCPDLVERTIYTLDDVHIGTYIVHPAFVPDICIPTNTSSRKICQEVRFINGQVKKVCRRFNCNGFLPEICCPTAGKMEDEELYKSDNYRFYPQPSSSYTILSGVEGKLENFRVLDVTGRTVLETTVQDSCNDCVLDLSPLSSGVYLIELLIDGRSSIHKLIKQ